MASFIILHRRVAEGQVGDSKAESVMGIIVIKSRSRSVLFITSEDLKRAIESVAIGWLSRVSPTKYESKLSGQRTAEGINSLYSKKRCS